MLIFLQKKIILLFLGNHISHNFTIHIDKHNYITITICYERPDKCL